MDSLDILFKDITTVTMTTREPSYASMCVGVKGENVTYVGPYHKGLEAVRVIDGKDKVLMPALYNCHCHTPMSLLRGYANDMALQEWLFEHIFPAEQKITGRMTYIGAMLSIAEMVASGTACFTDMYYGLDNIAEAAAQTGVKINLCNAVLELERKKYRFDEDICYKETISVINKYHNTCGGRIKADIGVHGEYTSYDQIWLQTAAFAKEHGLHMHVHLSETKFEHEECKKRYGKTPAQVLSEHNLFDVPTTAAHCVWLEDADIDILARYGVTAAHNPISNQKLASGIAPVQNMIKKGVNVALGTDGMASNNSHDMFEEIKSACLMQKLLNYDPSALPAYEALRMATVNGALSQGRQNESGMIKEGFNADLVMLDFHNPRQTLCFDPIAAIAYSVTGRDVAMTMCQGQILYENGEYKTLDIEKVLFEANDTLKIFTQNPIS